MPADGYRPAVPESSRTAKGGLLAGAMAVVLVVAAVGVWAYNNRGSDDATAASGALSDPKAWTVLQYQIADTDLEPFMMKDVAEMGEVGSNENLNIVALVDRSSDYTKRGVLGLKNWDGAKLLEVHEGVAKELDDMGQIDTGDPAVLADFVAEGIERYPAEHYALIMSDHGASWPGVGGDESADNDALTLAEIRNGVQAGLDEAHVDKLDLLGFDACLMATYEVASNVAPLAERMVASEELEPGHGWDYRKLQILADDPDTDVDAFSRAIVDGFGGQAEDEGTDAAITLSSLDLTKMPELDAALADFSVALQGRVGDLAPVVGQKRAHALSFGRLPDPTMDTYMTDLGALTAEIREAAPAIAEQADALSQALDDVVQDSLDSPATGGATGLSIYFPPEPEYFKPEYDRVDKTAAWSQFLQSYYGTGAAIPAVRQPRFVDTDGLADVSFSPNGVHLTGTFDPAATGNLTDAIVAYGMVGGDDEVVFIGEEPADISPDGSGTVTGDYDLTALTVSDGTTTQMGYLDLEVDKEAGVASIDVPMAYYETGDPTAAPQMAMLHLTVNTTTGDALESTTYLLGEDGMVGELTPADGSVMQPVLLARSADGTLAWQPSDDTPLSADGDLTIDFAPLPMQTPVLAQLALTDYGGNEATLDANFIVP
jgi:hypothetical protein